MLEQQQSQLVSGLQELYKRLCNSEQWDGVKLEEVDGRPLTHDILSALRILESKQCGETEGFEENVEKLQARLLAAGAGYSRRRASVSSESEHSHHGHARSETQDAPPSAKLPRSATLPTIIGSSSTAAPTPVQVQARPQRPVILASHDSQMSQLSQMSAMSPLCGDPHLYQPEWAFAQASTAANKRMAAQFALQNERIYMAEMAGVQAQQQQIQQKQQAPSFDPISWNTRTDSAHDVNLVGASANPWATQQYMNLLGASSTVIPRSSFDALADEDQMDLDLTQYIQSSGV
jgi:hypothetical protein